MLRAAPGGAVLPLMLLLMVLTPVPSQAGGDPYWSYSYRNVDVMAEGTSAYAVNLARYCVRLDAMLTRILGIKTSYRAPTHIYALPTSQLSQFLGSASASYQASAYDNTIILDNVTSHDSEYWGAYFGYTATLLASDGRLRGPDWYMKGVPLVFADTSYRGSRVTLGNVTRGYALMLGHNGSLIPLRRFLSMQSHAAGRERELYEAQSWALAHEIYVEGWRRAEFVKYLDLMRNGTNEAAAFAASFDTSYEELDKQFASAINRRAYVYTLDAPDDAAAGENARPLSGAEVKARLALLSARRPEKGPDPVQLATEALAIEPHNQTALLALALGELKRDAYGESLAAIDKVVADSPADAAYADIAFVLAGLTRAAASGQATLPVAADALRLRARQAYERALAANGEDRRSRDGLAQLGKSQSP
jgi:hypothetical protein